MRMLAGTVAGVAAAVIWAVSLAVYQPFMQPTGYFTDPATGQAYPNLGGNNTYWPRDIRQIAILLALAAVILIAGTARRALVTAAAGAFAWLGADLALDRFDVAGPLAATVLAVAGAAWFAGMAFVSARGRTESPLRFGVATVAGLLGAAALLVTTPWEEPVTRGDQVRVENALTLMQLVLVALAFAVAIGLAAPVSRMRMVAALSVVAAAGTAAAAVWPIQLPGTLGLLAVVAAATVTPLAARGASPARLGLLGLTAVLVAVPLTVALAFGTAVLGSAMTAMAGNPAVNAADTDASLAVAGLIAAIGMALVSHVFGRDQTAGEATGGADLAYN